jgi:hypothetical protein
MVDCPEWDEGHHECCFMVNEWLIWNRNVRGTQWKENSRFGRLSAVRVAGYINNIITLVIPKDDPELSSPYSMISGPFTGHVLCIGMRCRVIFEFSQDFFDSIFGFFRKAIEVFYGVTMDNDFTHQMESRSR